MGLFSKKSIETKEFSGYSQLITINGKSFVLSDWGDLGIAITSSNEIQIKDVNDEKILFKLGDKRRSPNEVKHE